jgi:leucyl-tRNA synthetase
LAEELWEQLGHTTSIHLEDWPSFDAAKLTSGEVSIAVQVNGKVRGVLTCPQGTPEATVLALARGDQKIAPWVEKGSILRVIYVPDKVINIVLGGD